MTSAIGKPPSFPDFTGDDLLSFIDMFRQAQADAGGLNPTSPVMRTRGAGEVDPTGRGTGSIDQRRPPQFAGSEADVQALERQQAGPADLAALGAPMGSPDHLLFDRAGMGGGAGGFTGRADPFGARQVPLPPERPSLADLMFRQPEPATTGGVQGMNPDRAGAPAPSPIGLPAPTRQPTPKESDIFRPGSGSTVSPPGQGQGDAGMLPVNSFDPLTGQVVSGQPQPLGRPGAPPQAMGYGSPQAPGAGVPPGGQGAPQPGLIERFATGASQGNPELANLLRSISIGLLPERGIGPGIGAGLALHQQSQGANLKQNLEMVKFYQQQQMQNAARDFVRSRGGSAELQALAMANPGAVLTGGLGGLNTQPPANYRLAADGRSYEFIPGSAADPKKIEQDALASAPDKAQTPLTDIEARRKVGIPDSDTRPAWSDPNGKVTFNDGPPPLSARPGQTIYDRTTLKPILTAPSAKPDNFDVESKLRAEYAKGLGSFGDVHDGYGRVIAATKQRAANPNTVSPASDINLIFGYMKMLDPGSVVREGEYATAKNAAGVPERVLNAYNKLIDGQFLTDRQRQDFLDQAGELYGTARKTAEGVAERHRGLATSYGVDPGRAVYMPEAPVAPRLGGQAQGAQGQGQAPSNAAASRYQQLRQSGLSQADAYARMHAEGM